MPAALFGQVPQLVLACLVVFAVVAVPWLVNAWRAFGRSRVLVDPWQTKAMAQRLRADGVDVTEYNFTAQSVGRLALVLYRALRDHTLALPADDELIAELVAVRLRETSPGCYRLDHSAGKHDDRTVALALCVHALVERARRGQV